MNVTLQTSPNEAYFYSYVRGHEHQIHSRLYKFVMRRSKSYLHLYKGIRPDCMGCPKCDKSLKLWYFPDSANPVRLVIPEKQSKLRRVILVGNL